MSLKLTFIVLITIAFAINLAITSKSDEELALENFFEQNVTQEVCDFLSQQTDGNYTADQITGQEGCEALKNRLMDIIRNDQNAESCPNCTTVRRLIINATKVYAGLLAA